MLINLIEHEARTALLSLIEEINWNKSSSWGLAFVKRALLKSQTNDAFLMAVKPALQDAMEAKLFVLENGDFYIVWRGMAKRIHAQLCDVVGRTLLREGAAASPESAVAYFDPQVMGNELGTLLRAGLAQNGAAPLHGAEAKTPWHGMFKKEGLQASAGDLEKFREALARRPERKQLEMLVVEDQQLLRRLLHEVLRTEHVVHSAPTLHEGWKLYLEKAPNIAFLDIGLADGSGHDLARAIKMIDPAAYVVMVTANSTPDEIEMARNNHVDGFVGKPYSRQQIGNFISKYIIERRLPVAKRVHA
ncbi:MAG TPA: response regulator [Alphaproteobacteria bacterium]|nr:response regulator [Alphaproteobacteria bacterium]